MICLKSAKLGELLKMGYPLETYVYWVDYTDNTEMSAIYKKYLETASKLFEIDVKLIDSISRKWEVTEARHMIWSLMRFNDGMSCSKIGKLAKRSHSTILVCTDKIKERIKVDKKLKVKYDALYNSLDKADVQCFYKKFGN